MSNSLDMIFTEKEFLAMELRRYLNNFNYFPNIDALSTQELKELLSTIIGIWKAEAEGFSSLTAEDDSA